MLKHLVSDFSVLILTVRDQTSKMKGATAVGEPTSLSINVICYFILA